MRSNVEDSIISQPAARHQVAIGAESYLFQDLRRRQPGDDGRGLPGRGIQSLGIAWKLVVPVTPFHRGSGESWIVELVDLIGKDGEQTGGRLLVYLGLSNSGQRGSGWLQEDLVPEQQGSRPCETRRHGGGRIIRIRKDLERYELQRFVRNDQQTLLSQPSRYRAEQDLAQFLRLPDRQRTRPSRLPGDERVIGLLDPRRQLIAGRQREALDPLPSHQEEITL